MKRAVIALGSNLGDRMNTLRHAADALDGLIHTRVQAVSRVYETDPVGYADQPQFLNAAVVVETDLSARALLGACLGIEAALGRVRTFQNAPRTVDMDLLVMEGETGSDTELMLPHPRIGGRAFVLVPLRDLFPDLQVLDVDFSTAPAAADCRGIHLWPEALR